MKSVVTHCPNCNSSQNFATKRREIKGMIQKYIVCHMCKTEFVLDTLTVAQDRTQRRAIIRRNQDIRRLW